MAGWADEYLTPVYNCSASKLPRIILSYIRYILDFFLYIHTYIYCQVGRQSIRLRLADSISLFLNSLTTDRRRFFSNFQLNGQFHLPVAYNFEEEIRVTSLPRSLFETVVTVILGFRQQTKLQGPRIIDETIKVCFTLFHINNELHFTSRDHFTIIQPAQYTDDNRSILHYAFRTPSPYSLPCRRPNFPIILSCDSVRGQRRWRLERPRTENHVLLSARYALPEKVNQNSSNSHGTPDQNLL